MTGVLATRTVRPERLDSLPFDAPAARASRRDLRRLNALMGHRRILLSLLREHLDESPQTVVDIGCGDGMATLAVAQALAPHWPDVALTFVDAQPLVSETTRARIAELGWLVDVVTADVFDWLHRSACYDLALTNLFLHHFDGPALNRLLVGIAHRSRTVVAMEPRRSTFAYLAARSVGAIGANDVTRHDAPASVRAGFSDRELAALWSGDVMHEGPRGLFTHAFVANGTLP